MVRRDCLLPFGAGKFVNHGGEAISLTLAPALLVAMVFVIWTEP